ncbi:nicotinate dehydrogenase medium molybdopterin subunit [Chloroflexota bacterium]|nr:nicotinate dehydrogenase medium molybdopterin subunit [Chloroflexota bacterium]
MRLYDAAFNLPFHLLRIDGAPHIIGANHIQHVHVAGFNIHLHIHDFGDIAVGNIRVALASLGIQHGGRARHIAKRGQRRPFLIVPLLQRKLGSAADGVAGHECEPRCRRAARVSAAGGVRKITADFLQWQAQRTGGHLQQHSMRTLPAFSGGVAQHRALNLGGAVQLNRGHALFGRAE